MHRPVLSYLNTYRSNAPSGGPFGVFHPCLRPLAPGCTLGRITKNDKMPVHPIKERKFLNCPSSGATVPRNERSIKLSFFGPFVFSVDLSLLEANSPIYRIRPQASVDRECPTCLQRHLSNILKYFLGYQSLNITLTVNPNPISDPNPKNKRKQNDT